MSMTLNCIYVGEFCAFFCGGELVADGSRQC